MNKNIHFNITQINYQSHNNLIQLYITLYNNYKVTGNIFSKSFIEFEAGPTAAVSKFRFHNELSFAIFLYIQSKYSIMPNQYSMTFYNHQSYSLIIKIKTDILNYNNKTSSLQIMKIGKRKLRNQSQNVQNNKLFQYFIIFNILGLILYKYLTYILLLFRNIFDKYLLKKKVQKNIIY